jgi:hypothetical protein
MSLLRGRSSELLRKGLLVVPESDQVASATSYVVISLEHSLFVVHGSSHA